MNKKMKKAIDNMSLPELRNIQAYIDKRIQSSDKRSWNSRIKIDEICLDYELRQFLDQNNIHTMQDFKENGLSHIPESLIDKANWTLKMFDFDGLEKQYRKKIN